MSHKKQPSLASVLYGPALTLACTAIISSVIACSGQNSALQPPPSFLFDKRPFQMNCLGSPAPAPPGTRAIAVFSPHAPYARTRIDSLQLPLDQVPALTIAADPINWIQIAGVHQDQWNLRFCAKGEGNTADEATGYLQKISIERTGSLLTLNNTDARGLTGGQGTLLLEAPAQAPVTIHSDAAVEVHDMAGPVRISARGRATLLDTSGLVDASAMIVDFAGSTGQVSLNAPWDINIKLTAQQFRGNLNAYAQRQVHMLLPPGFQTPIEILVNHPKDFLCRADFCSQIKKDRDNSLYRFTYGNTANGSEHIGLRSENAQVTLDTRQ